MRAVLLLFLILLLINITIFAQEEVDCSAEAIQAQVDILYQEYLALTGTDALANLSALNVQIEAILAACETSASAETTPEARSGELNAANLIEGKWEVQWSNTAGQTCSGQGGTTATNRVFILTSDSATDSFIADDILVWPPLIFTASLEGGYQFLRNIALNDGSVVSYDYRVSLLSESRIEGTSVFFDPLINCVLENNFVMTLVDETIICMIANETGANLRSGPGTEFQRRGALAASERTDVIGQARGSDGFVWWQLEPEAWVRSDVVTEAGRCEEVLEVEV